MQLLATQYQEVENDIEKDPGYASIEIQQSALDQIGMVSDPIITRRIQNLCALTKKFTIHSWNPIKIAVALGSCPLTSSLLKFKLPPEQINPTDGQVSPLVIATNLHVNLGGISTIIELLVNAGANSDEIRNYLERHKDGKKKFRTMLEKRYKIAEPYAFADNVHKKLEGDEATMPALQNMMADAASAAAVDDRSVPDFLRPLLARGKFVASAIKEKREASAKADAFFEALMESEKPEKGKAKRKPKQVIYKDDSPDEKEKEAEEEARQRLAQEKERQKKQAEQGEKENCKLLVQEGLRRAKAEARERDEQKYKAKAEQQEKLQQTAHKQAARAAQEASQKRALHQQKIIAQNNSQPSLKIPPVTLSVAAAVKSLSVQETGASLSPRAKELPLEQQQIAAQPIPREKRDSAKDVGILNIKPQALVDATQNEVNGAEGVDEKTAEQAQLPPPLFACAKKHRARKKQAIQSAAQPDVVLGTKAPDEALIGILENGLFHPINRLGNVIGVMTHNPANKPNRLASGTDFISGFTIEQQVKSDQKALFGQRQ